MNPKMKIKAKPAVHASMNIGLRAPVDGSIILESRSGFLFEWQESDRRRQRRQLGAQGGGRQTGC